MWHGTELSRVSEKDFLSPAGQRLHPGFQMGLRGQMLAKAGIHHFYICAQIPNKEVIILPSLYHAI